MLVVNQKAQTIRWDKTLDKKMTKQKWTISVLEDSDDAFYTGYEGSAEFKGAEVKNVVKKIKSEKAFSFDVVKANLRDKKSVTVSCWSLECPSWLHYDEVKMQFWTKSEETFFDGVAGTFIYFAETTDIETSSVIRETFTFIMSHIQP